MPRLRFYDVRNSRLPGLVGLCTADTARLTSLVNAAQRRLLFCPESGDEGWWGTWAEVAFNVSRTNPTLTLPRQIARLEAVVLCDQPVPLNNQFYEYLQFGNGRMPKQFRQINRTCIQQGFQRNNTPTFIDLHNAPQYLKFYISNEADAVCRVFVAGMDGNSKKIWSIDAANRVEGQFYSLASPFAVTAETFTRISGLQKDQTVAPVEVWQVDPVTGDEVLLTIMEPSETTASYRRYYFDNLPLSCCPPPVTEPQTLQLRAMCKLEPLNVYSDSDYLVIQNLEAIIEECNAVRYSEMDTVAAKQLEQNAHKKAVAYLNGELTHYMGLTKPAVLVTPYGSASLAAQRIGTMI